ncbi:MAG: succinylglutamate desuccinylase/aspartoacylase family protein [Hyphomicrobiaceae bacterium]|nr:succinylglutamate desuccinylase/aspartoacylase family protein [Hyphomicrobiaceae bacterium]
MGRTLFIGGETVAPGERRLVRIPVSKLSIHTEIALPVHVLNGRSDGPAMFVSAAIHGDELNGIEIARRLLEAIEPDTLVGTLYCVPVVNAFGFIARSRYLPDRRDLNRSFPGTQSGSLAARLAHIFMTEVVARCEVGVDLHTAAIHRDNYPQVRCALGASARLRELAIAFGAGVVLDSPERPGSLRKTAREVGVDVLVYEGGEGLRFDEPAIATGVGGVLAVMRRIGMLAPAEAAGATISTREPVPTSKSVFFATASRWVRAPDAGIVHTQHKLGQEIHAGEVIGTISSPFETSDIGIVAPHAGVIIGQTTLPVVNMGDALFHIAWSDASRVPAAKAVPSAEPLLDEDEIL